MPTISNAPCPDAADSSGCAYSDAAAITAGAYGDACRNPAGCVYSLTREGRYHELGHVFDRRHLTDLERAWLTRRLGQPADTPWREPARIGRASPAELFADAYMNCALGNGARRWATSYGYAYRLRRHRDICSAISILGLMR